MKSFKSLAAAIAVSIALASTTPAFASGAGNHDRIAVSASLPSTTGTQSSACSAGLARARCGQEQSRLLEAVAKMARVQDAGASQHDISRRQLNALIASVN